MRGALVLCRTVQPAFCAYKGRQHFAQLLTARRISQPNKDGKKENIVSPMLGQHTDEVLVGAAYYTRASRDSVSRRHHRRRTAMTEGRDK